ncbi:MAG: sporulation protein YunB [Ruminococcaceae bacterium]|nr:sporulation protein YunB [Oscillospiraceae bacterium]
MRLWKKRKKYVPLFIISAFFVLTVVFLYTNVRPMIIELAIAETSDVVTLTVNNTITEILSRGRIQYSDLVTFEKDSEGRITALITDMANANSLQAEITNEIILRLADEGETIISIPMGNFFNSTLLSGKGPEIDVNIVSVTNIDTSFENQFSAAGINQTQHQIMLNISIELTILVPGYSSGVTVPVQMCVAETVIVGEVPGSYADIN